MALARGSGPTYGGYHRPTNLDLGIQLTIDAILSDPTSIGPDLLVSALREAHRQRPQTDQRTWAARHEHPAWAITIGTLSGHTFHIAHVGICRVYLWSKGFLRLLTVDQSIEAQLLAEGSTPPADAFRYTESRLFGVSAEPPEIETLSVSVSEGDLLLFTSPGIWRTYDTDALAAVISSQRADLDSLVETLLDGSQEYRGLGTTIAIGQLLVAEA